MYRDLKETDSWLILSTGRAGSILLQNIIKIAYTKRGFMLKQTTMYEKTGPLESGEILHSHYPDHLWSVRDDTNIIMLTRDIAEVTLSNCISNRMKKWHYYANDLKNVKITPFVLDVQDFKNDWATVIAFQQEAALILNAIKNKNVTIIKYNDFKDNTTNIFNLLNLMPYNLIVRFYRNNNITLPVKTPGEHKDWILNWDEISDTIKSLKQEQSV